MTEKKCRHTIFTVGVVGPLGRKLQYQRMIAEKLIAKRIIDTEIWCTKLHIISGDGRIGPPGKQVILLPMTPQKSKTKRNIDLERK